MDNFDPYNVFLAIATNIPQRLNTVFWSRVTFQLEEKKPFGFSPEATRGRIEQNITNARFFKA